MLLGYFNAGLMFCSKSGSFVVLDKCMLLVTDPNLLFKSFSALLCYLPFFYLYAILSEVINNV